MPSATALPPQHESVGWLGGALDVAYTLDIIRDCKNQTAPSAWLGDNQCDDGVNRYDGHEVFFNCSEFGNDRGAREDHGDCDPFPTALPTPAPTSRPTEPEWYDIAAKKAADTINWLIPAAIHSGHLTVTHSC